jgi:hypothetical protein
MRTLSAAMFTVTTEELLAVRDALRQDPANLGVGILHLATGRVALRPIEQLRHRGGHVELVAENYWTPEECLGFIVARPAGECQIINLSQLNSRAGYVYMPPGTFRDIVLNLRQCWAGMAACGSTE